MVLLECECIASFRLLAWPGPLPDEEDGRPAIAEIIERRMLGLDVFEVCRLGL